ncbi:MAG: SiaB family protein kinase [Bacteroidota bacterium]
MENPENTTTSRQKSLKHFFGFHEIMKNNEVILVYAGDFSQQLTKTLLAFTEKKFSIDELEDIVRRKIFNIMVEMLQNISKNAVNHESENGHSPIFMIGETEDDYLLITSNRMSNQGIPTLKNRLDEVNSLNADGLKKLYKQVRLNGSFSEIGGAGIGIIDMARKSGNKLVYYFEELDSNHSMFSLLITVSKTYK